jgi:hypothetical protein
LGTLNIAISNEIRKYVKGENKYVNGVKKRILDIVTKQKNDFFHKLMGKLEKIKVMPNDNKEKVDVALSDEPKENE